MLIYSLGCVSPLVLTNPPSVNSVSRVVQMKDPCCYQLEGVDHDVIYHHWCVSS